MAADHFVVEIELSIPDDDSYTTLLGPFRQEEAAERRREIVQRRLDARDRQADEESFGEHSWYVRVRPLWKPSLDRMAVARLARS